MRRAQCVITDGGIKLQEMKYLKPQAFDEALELLENYATANVDKTLT